MRRTGLNVIWSPRDAGGSGGAVQPEHGNTTNIRGEAHAVDQERINRWTRDTGYGREKESAEVARCQPSTVKSAADGLLAQLDSGLNPEIIGLAPGCQLGVSMQR